jgi:hypothetical protein
MALALKDRVKETTIVVGTGTATLLGSSIGFQPFSVVGNGNTTYYCISDQFGSNWEVGIGTYSTSGNTLARTTVLASSNGGALVVFTAGVKDVFVTYPAEKGVWLDASGNAIGLGTPAAFVGTNITGTASGLTSGNVTTNANLTGAVTSSGNATSLGSFTSAQLALAISDETGTGKAVFATNPTLTSPTYAGTLTGSTDILNIGSGQVYKDASGKVGINVVPAAGTNAKLQITGLATNATTLATAYSDASLVVVPKSTSGYSLAIASGTSDFPQLQVSANGAASGDLLIQPYGGNVGIGTSSPSGKLNIAGTEFAGVTFNSPTYPTNGTYIGLDGTGVLAINNRENKAITVSTNNTERMRIDSSGNVGINTSSPVAKLTVAGDSFVSYTGSAGLLLRNLGSENRIDSYNYPITANYPLSILGSLIRFSTQDVERMRIDSNGVPMFNCTSQLIRGGETFRAQLTAGIASFITSTGSYPVIALRNTGTNGYMMSFNNAGAEIGTISSSGSNVAYNTSSDYRLKDNVEPMVGALNTVAQLKPVNWKWKADGSDGQGFIAHELAEVCPHAVTGGKDAVDAEGNPQYQGIDTSFLVATLTAAIQEQQTLIEALTARLTKAGL